MTNKYDAESAIAALDNLEPDIILSDVVMNDMSGYEFAKIEGKSALLSHPGHSDYSKIANRRTSRRAEYRGQWICYKTI